MLCCCCVLPVPFLFATMGCCDPIQQQQRPWGSAGGVGVLGVVLLLLVVVGGILSEADSFPLVVVGTVRRNSPSRRSSRRRVWMYNSNVGSEDRDNNNNNNNKKSTTTRILEEQVFMEDDDDYDYDDGDVDEGFYYETPPSTTKPNPKPSNATIMNSSSTSAADIKSKNSIETLLLGGDTNWQDNVIYWTPVFIPILAYLTYDPFAEGFAYCLDRLANNNWVAVDGGAYQAKIIAPAINGVVVPAISILFANLIGTTISTLRQRQIDIQTSINMEAGQLRILQSILDVYPDQASQTNCRRYLTQYTSRLIAESQPTVSIDSLGMDTELNGLLAELNRLSSMSSSSKKTEDTEEEETAVVMLERYQLLLGQSYTACLKLYDERAKRLTALRSLFPPLHFIIVSTLAVSICVAFLLESNQVLLVFLNAIQLRILWTMLLGTFSALAIVCYDLGNPFRGSYEISKSVDQLYTIRWALRTSLQTTTTATTKTTKPASKGEDDCYEPEY